MWPFSRKQPAEPVEAVPCFRNPKEQKIFRYGDGVRDRVGDPLRILRELTSDPTLSLEIDYKLSETECPETLNAIGRVADVVRKAFDIPPVEQGGLTDANCKTLIDVFCLYLNHIKKKGPSGPTTSPPTTSPSADSPTRNTSA